MAEKVENLKPKAVLLSNDSGSDSDWESKADKGAILGVSLEKLNDIVSDSDRESKEDKGDILGVSLEKLNLRPAKKLLVLHLDGELCHRVFIRDKASFPQGREADAAYRGFRIFRRPYCEEFLKFCFQMFEVGIWSSAQMHNISGTLPCVMGEYRSKLLFIWDQVRCDYSGFNTLENKFSPIFFKDLKKLWDSPECKGKYSSANTLLIDVDAYTSLLNPPYTAIFPAEYKATHYTDTALGANGELRLYLEGLADADDVPTYVKEHPFGQPAITSAHPDWDYYSMVVTQRGKKTLSKSRKKLGKKKPKNPKNDYNNSDDDCDYDYDYEYDRYERYNDKYYY